MVVVLTDISFNENIKGFVFSFCNFFGRFGGLFAIFISEFVGQIEWVLFITAFTEILLISMSQNMKSYDLASQNVEFDKKDDTKEGNEKPTEKKKKKKKKNINTQSEVQLIGEKDTNIELKQKN